MAEREFEEAKLLYDLVTKSTRHIDKDRLSKVVPQLGFSTGTDDVLTRLDRLMRGLPAEDEFMAMAVWMEKCKLIHKLEQEQFPLSSSDKYQVPDILAVFDHNGQEIAVLIEVKTSEKQTFPFAKLRFAESLYERLNNYANLAGLPLLIAWRTPPFIIDRRGGYWMLFDIREMQQHESAYYMDCSDAMKADLMFLLLDSVHVVPKPGVSFTFVLEDLGPTRKKVSSGEEHIMKVRDVRFLDADGDPITKVSWPQFVLWMFAEHEEKQTWHGNLVDITFEVPEESSMLPSYALLPLILFEMRSEEKRPKNWYHVIKEGGFGPFSYSQFKQAMQDGIGTFVRYVFRVVPHKRPDFLPAE